MDGVEKERRMSKIGMEEKKIHEAENRLIMTIKNHKEDDHDDDDDVELMFKRIV